MSDELGILQALQELKNMAAALAEKQQVKEWYSTAEAARLLGKAEFTIREHARLGRIRAKKALSGRGAFPAWVIAHEEILRYQKEGLIPLAGNQNGCPRG